MNESSIEFNNYDILLLPNESNEAQVRFAPGNCVGNQRFLVFLSLYRQKYMEAYMFGEQAECEVIAMQVLTTVLDQCVPNGRIYELSSHANTWEMLDSTQCLTVIKKALKNEPRDTLYSVRAQSFNRATKPISQRSDNHFVESPKPFDIVCNIKNGRVVLEGGDRYTGNNRLKVMVDLRKDRYQEAGAEVKKEIAREVVHSILNASGRFLKVEKDTGRYQLMTSRKIAAVCVDVAFDLATLVKPKRVIHYSEAKTFSNRKRMKPSFDEEVPTTLYAMSHKNVAPAAA